MSDHPRTHPLATRAARPFSVLALLRRGLEGDTPSMGSEAAAAELAVLFPELRIEAMTARGGFSVVWRTEHRRLKRRAALKLLAASLTQAPVALARFEREMQAAGALDHPGIVRTFDAGERGGVWFLAMEWINGANFGELAGAGPLAPGDACELARQAALALHHAHERGLVHRDVKPANLMLARTDEAAVVKVLDFGIAQFAQDAAGMDLTHTGEFLGTVDYAAPEQVESPASVGVRTDIFGLGATLYRLLAGAVPRSTEEGGSTSILAKVQRIAREPVPSLAVHRPDLSPSLVAVVDQMLALDPGQRPATCAAIAEMLAPFCAAHDLAALLAGGRSAQPAACMPPGPPLPASREPTARKWRRTALFALAAIALSGTGALLVSAWRGETPSKVTNAARDPAPAPSPVADAPGQGPILRSPEWEMRLVKRLPEGVRSAHYSTDSAAIFFCTSKGAISRLELATGAVSVVVPDAGASALTTSTDGRWLAWNTEGGSGALGRARANAPWTRLPLLEPPTSGQAQREPRGLAFIRLGWQGPPPLQRGDFIVADASSQAAKGIWRFRCDSDGAPEQIVENLDMLEAAVDVTCTMQSVFVANRPVKRAASEPALPDDYTRRIFRLDGRQLVGCRTDKPIADPSAITAGSSGRLYVLNGHRLGGEPQKMQLLELIPASQRGLYTVHEILSHFTLLSDTGLDTSERGLLISDEGAGMLYELRRR